LRFALSFGVALSSPISPTISSETLTRKNSLKKSSEKKKPHSRAVPTAGCISDRIREDRKNFHLQGERKKKVAHEPGSELQERRQAKTFLKQKHQGESKKRQSADSDSERQKRPKNQGEDMQTKSLEEKQNLNTNQNQIKSNQKKKRKDRKNKTRAKKQAVSVRRVAWKRGGHRCSCPNVGRTVKPNGSSPLVVCLSGRPFEAKNR